MSIISSICADNANEVKAEWALRLEVAIKHKSWKEVEKIKSDMEEYLFSE